MDTFIKYIQLYEGTGIQGNLSAWLGDSVIQYEMYHGTDMDFDEFKKDFIGSNFGLDDIGFFFTSDIDSANRSRGVYPDKPKYKYDDQDKLDVDSGNIMSVFLRIENPLTPSKVKDWVHHHSSIGGFDSNRDIIRELLKTGEYDGFIDRGEGGEVLAVVLDPNQIKSIDNRGEWSRDSNNIYEKNTHN